jgi:threonine aldolase
MSAERLGKEAAVFVTSGTQGNICSILAHCQRGDEIVVGDQAHIFVYEVAGCAALGGIQAHTVPNGRGVPSPTDVAGAIRTENIHFPTTGLVCLENTHNRCGGAVITPAETAAIAAVAHERGVPVHLDGARVFNAAAALGLPVADVVRDVDSVTFCLSKGLSAPVGAVIAGKKEFVQRARKYRKMLGGGLRQSGILAAAGIVALERMVERLAEDHANARTLAEGLAETRGIRLDPTKVQSNIVAFDLAPEINCDAFLAAIAVDGVRANAFGPNRVRMVTHYGITADDIATTIQACRRALAA